VTLLMTLMRHGWVSEAVVSAAAGKLSKFVLLCLRPCEFDGSWCLMCPFTAGVMQTFRQGDSAAPSASGQPCKHVEETQNSLAVGRPFHVMDFIEAGVDLHDLQRLHIPDDEPVFYCCCQKLPVWRVAGQQATLISLAEVHGCSVAATDGLLHASPAQGLAQLLLLLGCISSTAHVGPSCVCSAGQILQSNTLIEPKPLKTREESKVRMKGSLGAADHCCVNGPG
jgi:hypothetical protein